MIQPVRWPTTLFCFRLPATSRVVGDFIAADAVTSASSNLKRRMAAIRKVHLLLRLPCPVDGEEVSIALQPCATSSSPPTPTPWSAGTAAP